MARPATNTINPQAVLQAALIEGSSAVEARTFVDLVKRVQSLGRKEFLLKAANLSEKHIGLMIDVEVDEIVAEPINGFITDVDECPTRQGSLMGGPMSLRTSYGPGVRPAVGVRTIVVDGKIRKLWPETLVKLTETRDI